MKAVLLSSCSHQAHTRKCPHPLPSSHRHRWLCPHHLCCWWFQHQLGAGTHMQMGQIKTFWWRHRAASLNIEVPSTCAALCAYNHVWEVATVFGRVEVSRNVVVLIWFVHEIVTHQFIHHTCSGRLQYWSPPPPRPTAGSRLERRSRCIFLGCNVSTNNEKIALISTNENQDHSHLSPRPQSQWSASSRRFRQNQSNKYPLQRGNEWMALLAERERAMRFDGGRYERVILCLQCINCNRLK